MAQVIPLGAAIVATPGTAVLLVAANNANIAAARNNHTFVVQALTTMTGIVYLLSNSSAADTTNYTNVIYSFQTPGETFGQGSTAVNDLDITKLYIDATAADAGVSVVVVVS